MRFSSLRYLIKEGFRSLWQNRFMAVASIGVLVSCLLLTGGAYLVFVNIDSAFDWVYGRMWWLPLPGRTAPKKKRRP